MLSNYANQVFKKGIFSHPIRPTIITTSTLSNVIRYPPKSLEISLPHNHTTHKDLNRPYSLQRHLALARRLPKAQLVSEFLFTNSVWVVDLIAKNTEGDFGEIFHCEKGVEFSFRFGEAFVVFSVNEKDDAGNFGEVIFPETAS